jgi:hypothetical protein
VLVSGKRFVAHLIEEDQEAVAGWFQLRLVGTARVMLYEIQNPDTKANGVRANNVGFSRLNLVGGGSLSTTVPEALGPSKATIRATSD